MPRPRAEQLKTLPGKQDQDDKATASDSSDGGNSGKEFEVESIVSHQVDSKGNWIFRTKWVGWPEESNTNEPLQHFLGSSDVLSAYLRKHGFHLELDKKSKLLSVSKLETSKEPLSKSGDKADPKAVKVLSAVDKNPAPVPVGPVPLKQFSKDKVMLPTFNISTGKPAEKRKSQSLTKAPLTKTAMTKDGNTAAAELRTIRKESRQASTSTSESSSPSPVAIKKAKLQIFRPRQTGKPSTEKRKRQKFSFVTAEISSETDEEFDEYTVEDPTILQLPGGYAQGKVAEKILGVADLNERPIRYIVKWTDSNTVEPVPSDLVLQEDPYLLLNFFESRLVDKAEVTVKRFKR